jgi:Tc5 transposase DNA-binding domain
MVNKAKSQELRKQIHRKEVDDLKAYAAKLYTEEQSRSLAPGEKKKSSRQICQDASDAHFMTTRRRIPLSHKTLIRHAQGGVTLTESNRKKSWLSEEEQKTMVEFAIDLARRGFPLSPRRLKDHAEAILRHRLGDGFPEGGLGKDWASRFITKHKNRLGMYWSTALDGSRGRAVNPITKEEYFRLLKEVRELHNIPDELVYGADETGIQSGIGVTERVIGPAGAKIQHQQRSGTRENITVLPTICADGTTVAPTVIYKGEAFQTKWLQENPLDARYDSKLISLIEAHSGLEWDIRRKVIHRVRLVWRGSKTGICKQKQRQAGGLDSSLSMATVLIIPLASWSMHETTTLLYCAIPPIPLMSTKVSMLSSSVS